MTAAQDPTVELLWFADCPNHADARALVSRLLVEHGVAAPILDIDATNPDVATQHRFPGSPTIRIDGVDVDPGYVDPGDYTPRCRLYRTPGGLRPLPETEWIVDALERAIARRVRPGA